MTRRVIVVVLASAVLALTSAAAAPRAQAVGFVDKQVQAGALLIQNYINTYGQAHRFVYPPKAMVKKGGGLTNATVIWPSNPWTGRVMAPGTSRGTYTYTLGAGNLSYRLTVHLSSGSYVLKGALPAWLKAERVAAAADLRAAHDQTAELGGRLIKGFVDQWGLLNNGTAPSTNAVAADGDLASFSGYWPHNPFTGQPMAASSAQGDYSYAHGAGGAYSLAVRGSSGAPVDLSGTVPQQVRTALESLKSALTNASIWKIRSAVDRFSHDHAGALPEEATPSLLGAYLDPWPGNPFIAGQPMTDGSMIAGNYDYARSLAGTYTITAYVSGGVAGETVSGPLLR